jgi:hypothetical protein
VGSVVELVDWMRGGEKPASEWRVGTEHEKIGLHDEDGSPVAYEGANGIAVLLDRVAGIEGWSRISEDGQTVALAKDDASITLEPGGQLEPAPDGPRNLRRAAYPPRRDATSLRAPRDLVRGPRDVARPGHRGRSPDAEGALPHHA